MTTDITHPHVQRVTHIYSQVVEVDPAAHLFLEESVAGPVWGFYCKLGHVYAWISGFHTFETARDALAAKLERAQRHELAEAVRGVTPCSAR